MRLSYMTEELPQIHWCAKLFRTVCIIRMLCVYAAVALGFLAPTFYVVHRDLMS